MHIFMKGDAAIFDPCFTVSIKTVTCGWPGGGWNER
jgi:hypothetical protein